MNYFLFVGRTILISQVNEESVLLNGPLLPGLSQWTAGTIREGKAGSGCFLSPLYADSEYWLLHLWLPDDKARLGVQLGIPNSTSVSLLSIRYCCFVKNN